MHNTCCLPGSFFWYSDFASNVNEFSLYNLTDGSNCTLSEGTCGVRLSYIPYQMGELNEHDDYMDTIANTADAIRSSGFSLRHVFPQGANYVFWQVFEDLYYELRTIFLTSVAVNFIITAIVLWDLGAAIVVSMICVSITMQVGGLICFFGEGLDWNMFTSSIFLASIAIAIEDVAHTVSFFLKASGSREERIAAAMKDAFIALSEGSISTLVSIAPMWFHPVGFYKIYYVIPMSILVLVGIFNGLVFVPAILVTLDRVKEISCWSCEKMAQRLQGARPKLIEI
jgi:patched 1 protein